MSLLRSLRLLARIPSVLCAAVSLASSVRGDEMSKPWPEDAWRREHRIIDLHQHIDSGTQRVQRALRIMDRVGVGVGVNLSGGTVTKKPGESSEFDAGKNKASER